jgi:5-methylcytosine-specific restriction endonuclease McrA
VCNATTSLDVHHRTYERFGHEDVDDLTVLCRTCHDLFHARLPKRAKAPRTVARIPKAEKPRMSKKERKKLRALGYGAPKAGWDSVA